jgi:signal transduction histidine kinase
MLQGQRDLTTVGRMLLSELAPLVNAQQGVIYQMETEESAAWFCSRRLPETATMDICADCKIGEGLVGQCSAEKRRMLIPTCRPILFQFAPACSKRFPQNVIVLPVLFEDRVKAVIELASLSNFTASHLAFLEQLTASIGIVLNSIEATMQTEGLLKQSQQLATELQMQQKELQQTNEQLAQKAQQLAEQNVEVERKNQEIEQARRALEDKAKELALTSKYKSEFLANMSHELRTPLNSILVLGQQLSDNPDANLTPKQVEFARTIHGAGTDLLNLITRHSRSLQDRIRNRLGGSGGSILRQHAGRGGPSLPSRSGEPASQLRSANDPHLARSVVTDSKRLQQVLKNLLSNAFKFTEVGGVRLTVSAARSGWSEDHPILGKAASVVAFEVADTGIGIPFEKQRIIFEAFQQADAGTSRKYGGTGLGLAISRELASLLGGEIQLRSAPRPRQHLHSLPAADLCRTFDAERGFGGSAGFVQRSRPCKWRWPASPSTLSKRSRMIGTISNPMMPCCSSLRMTRIMRASCVISLGTKASRSWWRRVARKPLHWPMSIIPPQCPWTFSCPTCWAGRC